MRKAKRAVCLILSLAMVISMALSMTACSKAEPSGQTPTDTPTSAPTSTPTEPVEISILLQGDNTPAADNLVLQELGKRTNTKINMTYVPSKDLSAKKSTLAAANSLPDIFPTGGSETVEFKEGGMLAEVGDLINKYAPNIIANVGENLSKAEVNNDGIYLILNARLEYVDQLNMRTDWLKNLGLEMPTDLDSLYNVYYAFTHNDPDGNGKNDTYGLACDASPLEYATIFGAYGIPALPFDSTAGNKGIELADGTVTTWVKHPEFLEAMKYINKLRKDGLIEPDWATIPRMDMFGKLWNGIAGAIEWECVGPTNNWMPSRYTESTPPTFDFPIIKGPEGKYGTAAADPDLDSGYAFSSKCKNLEAAVKLANYCMSDEGSELLYLGVEGTMFNWTDKENGKYELLGEYKDSATHRAAGAFCYWWLFAPTNNAEVRTFNKQTQEGVALARKNGIEHVSIVKTLKSRTDYGADIDQILKEMFVELMATDGDLKPIYDKYIGRWEEEGGKEWEAEATAAWKAQKAK